MAHLNQQIDGYVLDERVGAGAFGEVWRAHALNSPDDVVAIKIPSQPEYIECLKRESHAIARLSHRNIVRWRAFEPYANPPHLVMEYVGGENLRQHLSRGNLLADEALKIMTQILEALQAAHHQGVTHCDLKPENILLCTETARDGSDELRVKLTDFGLGDAMIRNAQSILISQDPSERRNLAGTQAYMAPEQAEGGNIDGRADLYACGVIYFEMLTGRRPAGHGLPSELNLHVPRWMDEAFKASYCRLEKRVATAGLMRKLLQCPAPLVPQATLPIAPPSPQRAPNRKHRLSVIAGLAVVVLVWGLYLIHRYEEDVLHPKPPPLVPMRYVEQPGFPGDPFGN